MASVAVDQFMQGVLEDEGWMSGLDGDVIAAVIARLEALLPAGATLSEARADQLRSALRLLAAQVLSLSDSAAALALVAAWPPAEARA